jgi:outer membrane protein
MKKSLLIVNVVLAIAVVVLYVFHFCVNNEKSHASVITNADGSSVVAAEGSIVYIQIDSLVNSYDMFHDLKNEFEAKAKVAEDDLTKRGRSFEREAKDFQEKVQKGLITRSQAEELQIKLQQKQQSLQQYAENLRMEMAEEEAVMLRRIYDAVQTYLADYNKDRNYSLIISTSGTTNVILQGSSSLNITNDVLKGLNSSYVRDKK